ncbi:hypothetical protein AXF42_Ash019841 [Apostasia shenzhenica]|uniref:Uncharacterized protein n=1 Tax=Apostasia shenzhenica TaxID=1088818 RepID=A0A2I0ARG4_9ASPA|nr:hypothetical protein AXF42_Ash019841 [Apostasia shenzhenica]
MACMMLLRGRPIPRKPQLITVVVRPVNQRACAVRFYAGEPSEKKVDEDHEHPKPAVPSGDSMSDSFGYAYSTRSADEGFGGIYTSNEDEPSNSINSAYFKEHRVAEEDESNEENARNQEKAS